MTDLTTIPAVWPGRSHAGLMLCLGDMRSIAPILLLSSAIGGASRRIAVGLAGRSHAAILFLSPREERSDEVLEARATVGAAGFIRSRQF